MPNYEIPADGTEDWVSPDSEDAWLHEERAEDPLDLETDERVLDKHATEADRGNPLTYDEPGFKQIEDKLAVGGVLSALSRVGIRGKRVAYVLREEFGLDDDNPKTSEQIGDDLGISTGRVGDLKARGYKAARGYLEDDEDNTSYRMSGRRGTTKGPEQRDDADDDIQ